MSACDSRAAILAPTTHICPQAPQNIVLIFLRILALSQLYPNPDLPNIQAYQVRFRVSVYAGKGAER
jgi:hypothetical protein